jgi:hypothetical protein
VVQARGMPLAPAGIVTDCVDLRPFLPSGKGCTGMARPACAAQKRILNCAQPYPFPPTRTLWRCTHTGASGGRDCSLFSHQPEKGIRQALRNGRYVNARADIFGALVANW